jgi:hypothetical protein
LLFSVAWASWLWQDLLLFAQPTAPGGQYPGSLLAGLKWRDVGPMRGGRSYAVAGNADQPDTFYMGSVGGGVWKTENSGHSWYPISDEGIPIGSIGAIAVAPSNPNIVYVGTGEPDIRSQHSYGIGMYKSTDAGKTWTHIGLEASRAYRTHRRRPDESQSRIRGGARPRLRRQSRSAASFAPPTAAPPGRKFCSTRKCPTTWAPSKWPSIPRIRACSTHRWGTRRPPWSVYAPTNLPGGGLYKSTDGGDTWKQLTGGLPADDFVGKIGMAIAPSNPNRIWAAVDDTGGAVAPSRAAVVEAVEASTAARWNLSLR